QSWSTAHTSVLPPDHRVAAIRPPSHVGVFLRRAHASITPFVSTSFLSASSLFLQGSAVRAVTEPLNHDLRLFEHSTVTSTCTSRCSRFPGLAVGVARRDDLIYFKGLGYADLEKRTPITPNTVFWIASVTKTFTAVALKLLEEGG